MTLRLVLNDMHTRSILVGICISMKDRRYWYHLNVEVSRIIDV